MSLADETLAGLATPQKGLVNFVKTQKEILPNGTTKIYSGKRSTALAYQEIRNAHRYVISNDLMPYIVKLFQSIKSNKLCEAIIDARIPHNNTWIEWNEKERRRCVREFNIANGDATPEEYSEFSLDFYADGTGYLLNHLNDDSFEWLATPFSKGESGITTGPLGFAVYPNLNAPEIETDRDKELAICSIGTTYFHNSKRWRTFLKNNDFENIISGLHIHQTRASEWVDHNGFKQGVWHKSTKNLIDGDARFLICTLMVLNYDWIIRDDFVPKKTDKRMIRHGKAFKRNSHVTLTIDLPKIKGQEMLPHFPVEGGSKRQHEVRGHFVRYKKKPGKYWRKAHIRGNAKLGIITKDYVLDAA